MLDNCIPETVVLLFTFRSVIYFELVFLWDKGQISFSLFGCGLFNLCLFVLLNCLLCVYNFLTRLRSYYIRILFYNLNFSLKHWMFKSTLYNLFWIVIPFPSFPISLIVPFRMDEVHSFPQIPKGILGARNKKALVWGQRPCPF